MRHLIFSLSLAITLLALNPLHAQNPELKNGLTVKALFYDFDGPLLSKPFSFDDMGIGAEIGYFRNINEVINIGFPLRFGSVRLPLSDSLVGIDKSAFISLDGVVQLGWFKASNVIKPYVFTGIGGFLGDTADGNKIGAHIPLGLGFDIKITRNVYFELQSEYQLAFTDNRNDFTHSVGLKFLFGGPKKPAEPADIDGDGVPDTEDECPTLMGGEFTNGCPDTDQDGIADKDDKCPSVMGSKEFSGCPDTDNDGISDLDDDCPEQAGPPETKGCPTLDSDGDGVLDADDQCPNEAGSVSNNGCPEKDSDGDGVLDGQDNCPNQFGPASNNGCPLPDGDGDGVPDVDDRCPNAPGTSANNGCPEITPTDKAILQEAAQTLEFETSRATLKTRSFEILDNIIDILRRYPDYQLSISGHTDSVGSSEKNKILSERRAKSCFDYLVLKGIAANRVNYVGYGETQPIADNRYKDGRKKNRRVEFNMYLK